MDDNNSFLPTLQPSASNYSLRTKKLSTQSTHTHLSLTSSKSKSQSQHFQTKDDNVSQLNLFEDDKTCFLKLLDQSKEELQTDRQSKPVIGKEAIDKYQRHLKILDRVQEENRFSNQPDSVYTVMLKSARESIVLPCKVGLLKYEGPRDSIKLNNMKYGNKYIEMLQEGIKQSHQFEIFELTDNRITQVMAGSLLKSLSKRAREIILSKNRIGQIGITNISQQLIQKDCRIEVLDLEDNSLGNKLIKELCHHIQINQTIQKLNLSKNFITNSSCQAISSMLHDNTNIKELYLYWNQIRGEGGIQIFQSLNTNIYLKVLDISQNSLGLQQACATAFAELVIANNELLHVDLSFNYFNLKDTQIIADGLVKNQTIFGFHFTGNRGYVDSKGFLIPIDNIEEDQGQQQIALRIRGCKYQNQQRIRQFRDLTLKDCCWICEGWRQQDLNWKIGVSGAKDLDHDPAFIHLSYQDFSGLYFGNPQKGLKLSRMIPPGTTKYFFTIGQNQMVAKDQTSIVQNISLNNNIYTGVEQTTHFYDLNKMDVDVDKMIIDQYYDPQITILPRTKDLVYVPPRTKKRRNIWTFPISIFKSWVRDTDQEDLNQCFETDWNGSRIVKIIKNEQDIEDTKKFMKSIYPQIKDTYRHYSSFNPVGEVWAIQPSSFIQILQSTKLVNIESKDANVFASRQNNKNLTLVVHEDTLDKDEELDSFRRMSKAIIKSSDLDLKFIGTISGTEKGNPRKPDRGMIRFQFLEVWVRIAESKYLTNQVTTNMCDSMKFLWEDNLKQDFSLYAGQTWRDQRYWNENCDFCLKNYKSILDHLYSCNSKKKVKPGNKPFMSVQEFTELCQIAGLLKQERFPSSVPLLCYNKAMQTHIDELRSDRHFQMTFVEFLEAVARVADECSQVPYIGAFPEGTEFTYQKIKELPLHYKIESLVLLLLETCAEKSFSLNYKKPDTSFFTPVYDSDYE